MSFLMKSLLKLMKIRVFWEVIDEEEMKILNYYPPNLPHDEVNEISWSNV
jgi:hypothetical protein